MTSILPSSRIMTTTFDEEESGGSSDQSQKGDASGRKRKATENMNYEKTGEKDMKRQRNREAAKKCRERKILEKEVLTKKNEELEKENCELVRQRDELRKRCNALEEELRQHKDQGCTVSNPTPYCNDFGYILDPSTPPSPSFAGSRTPSPSPCASPASSVGQALVSRSALQTYEADPVLVQYGISGRAASARSGHSHAVTQPTACTAPANTSQVSREVSEMRAEPTSSPAASQKPDPPTQKRPQQGPAQQQYPLRVRLADGSPKDLSLSEEDYAKVMKRIRALQARQSDDAASVCASAPQKQQAFSMPRIRQENEPESVSISEVQSVSSGTVLAKSPVSVQNSKQHDLLISDDLLLSTDMIDDNIFDNLALVNPNDVFMQNELMAEETVQKSFLLSPSDILMQNELMAEETDQKSSLLSESDSGAVRREKAVITLSREDLAQIFNDQQMFTGKLIKADTTSTVMNPVIPSQLHFQTEKENKITEDSYLSNDRIITITVTDPKTAQVLEQFSSNNICTAEELALTRQGKPAEASVSTQVGLNLPLSLSKADCTVVPLTGATSDESKDAPVQLCTDTPLFAKHVLSFPTEMDQARGSEYQKPFPDSLLAMKTVKIRPKAAQLAKTISNSNTQVERLPHMASLRNAASSAQLRQDESMTTSRAAKNQSDQYPWKNALTVSPLDFASTQQTPLGILPALQNVSAGNSGLHLKVQHQHHVPQMPLISIPQQSNTGMEESFFVKGDDSVYIADPAPKTLLTASTREIKEYLAQYGMEALDTE